MNRQMDVRAALPTISLPTLVACWEQECLHITYGSRAFAELIPGAIFLELPGKGHLPFGGSDDARPSPASRSSCDEAGKTHR